MAKQPNLCLVAAGGGTVIAGFLSYRTAERWAAEQTVYYPHLTVTCDLTGRVSIFEGGKRVSYAPGCYADEVAA